jgi:hypothetical protein
MSWQEIAFYAFIGIVALHIVVGLAVYFIAIDREEKKKKQEEAAKLAKKRQAEDDRIEAVRKQREAAYYERLRIEQRAYAPTVAMPLVDPKDFLKKK